MEGAGKDALESYMEKRSKIAALSAGYDRDFFVKRPYLKRLTQMSDKIRSNRVPQQHQSFSPLALVQSLAETYLAVVSYLG
jgi:hypothetical protein